MTAEIWTIKARQLGLSLALAASALLLLSSVMVEAGGFAHDFANSTQISRAGAFPSLATTATTTGSTRDSSNVIGFAMRYRY